jgi:hypothetical protein
MSEQPVPQQSNQRIGPVLPTSGLATASLVTGILGFFLAPILLSIVALVTGYSARKETRAVPPTASGDGMATAGIIMGWIQLGLAVVGICCVIAYFVFIVGAVGWGSRFQ